MDLAKLQALSPDVLDKPSAFDKAEYEVLQAFYLAWEELHAVPKDKIHRKQAEAAAQNLVEQAHILRTMRDNRPKILVPRFAH